jgi:hypothetical protein
MNTDEHGYFDALTERVLGAVFEVSNTLGAGFPEKVYQPAPLRELRVEEVLVISPTNRPRSVSTICDPRAGVRIRSSEANRPLTRRLRPDSHRFVRPAIPWTIHLGRR